MQKLVNWFETQINWLVFKIEIKLIHKKIFN